MMFGHLLLFLISLKKPQISKFFIFYECLWSIFNITLPNGCPESQTVRLHVSTTLYALFLSFSYIDGLVPILVLRIYNNIVVKVMIYGDEVTKKEIQSTILVIMVSIAYLMILYLLISWIGEVYVKSEVSRVNNELILDNLDDGLIIIEESSRDLVFSNK